MDRLFVTDMGKISGEIEKKIVAIGTTKILCDCPSLLTPPYVSSWHILMQVCSISDKFMEKDKI